MVSDLSILGMYFSQIVSIAFPVALIVLLKVKYKASLKIYFIGVLTFLLGGLIIPSIVQTGLQFTGILTTGVLGILITSLITGAFQESSKFIVLRSKLKENNSVLEIITFGAGFTCIQTLIANTMSITGFIGSANMINEGKFFETYSQLQVSDFAINQLQDIYINTPVLHWWTLGVQVITLTLLHIALALLISKGVKEKNNKYYLLAIIIDSAYLGVLAMSYMEMTYLIIQLSIIVVVGIVSLLYILKTKKSS